MNNNFKYICAVSTILGSCIANNAIAVEFADANVAVQRVQAFPHDAYIDAAGTG